MAARCLTRWILKIGWVLYGRTATPKPLKTIGYRLPLFFAVRESDNKMVGMIDIRHHIDNEFLANYGGHIGYSVRPSERCKGYATEMLRLALEYAKTIGLSRVMLGCHADNIASAKTITNCGGILYERKPDQDKKPMNVYWIDIK